jgi:hypothetical protein
MSKRGLGLVERVGQMCLQENTAWEEEEIER